MEAAVAGHNHNPTAQNNINDDDPETSSATETI
jgi:hypothetical protein